MALFGVFDGHGGQEVAEYCRRHLGKTIIENEEYAQGKYDESLRQAFFKIDDMLEDVPGKNELAEMKRRNPPAKAPLFKMLGEVMGKQGGAGAPQLQEEPKEEGKEQTIESMALDSIGCTANVIMLEEDKAIHIANAGDSRSVLCRGGKAFALSFDHKPDNPIEKERIEKAGSVITEGRVDGNLNLSRSLGDLKYKQNKKLTPSEHPVTANPDTSKVLRKPEDEFIIMGCDGIWEKKDNQEMVDFVSERLKNKMELKDIISELLNELISPDYTQT